MNFSLKALSAKEQSYKKTRFYCLFQTKRRYPINILLDAGQLCKHQYLLWVSNFENATNFLPFLSAHERQKYAEIAIGNSLPSNFYEGIHDSVREPFQANKSHSYEESVNPTLNTKPSCSSLETPDMRRSIAVLTAQECKEKLQKDWNKL